jgi:hypothetical protein
VAGLAPDDLENHHAPRLLRRRRPEASDRRGAPPRRIFPSTDTVASLVAARFLDQWRGTVLDNTREIVPASGWERAIDIDGTPLWFLIRSLPCSRQSHIRVSTKSLTA